MEENNYKDMRIKIVENVNQSFYQITSKELSIVI